MAVVEYYGNGIFEGLGEDSDPMVYISDEKSLFVLGVLTALTEQLLGMPHVVVSGDGGEFSVKRDDEDDTKVCFYLSYDADTRVLEDVIVECDGQSVVYVEPEAIEGIVKNEDVMNAVFTNLVRCGDYPEA